jgi:antitoxin PrlF
MFVRKRVADVAAVSQNTKQPVYSGHKTKTGNSDALRFEKALFRSHPEFSGSVQAQVIAPGYMLVKAHPIEIDDGEDDPVIGAFLALLEKDLPSQIRGLDAALINRVDDLVGHIDVDLEEDLGDESLL